MKRISSVYILVFLVAALCATDAEAQRFNVGADIVSRYVWRGTDFGESVSIQPTLSFSAGGFEAERGRRTQRRLSRPPSTNTTCGSDTCWRRHVAVRSRSAFLIITSPHLRGTGCREIPIRSSSISMGMVEAPTGLSRT